MIFNILSKLNNFINKRYITKQIISDNSILTNNDITGNGDVEIVSACVMDISNNHTLNVKIGDELKFYILAKAIKDIDKPYFGIAIYNKNKDNELLFTGTTVQIDDYSKKMEAEDEVIIGFKVKMTMEAGEYHFRLSCAEPLKEHHPNKGTPLVAHNMLGPISVNWDYENERAPFYGIAQLPMEMIDE